MLGLVLTTTYTLIGKHIDLKRQLLGHQLMLAAFMSSLLLMDSILGQNISFRRKFSVLDHSTIPASPCPKLYSNDTVWI